MSEAYREVISGILRRPEDFDAIGYDIYSVIARDRQLSWQEGDDELYVYGTDGAWNASHDRDAFWARIGAWWLPVAEVEVDDAEQVFNLHPVLASADALVTEFARTLETLAAAHPEHDNELTDLASRVHMARLGWAQEHDQS